MGTLASGLLHLSHPTLLVRIGTAGSCQEQTLAALLDDLIGAAKKRERNCDAKRLGGL
jgi:hypothetical protein